MRTISKLTLLYLCLGFSGCYGEKYPSPEALYLDRKGAADLKAEKYEAALQRYYSVLGSVPESVSTHSNIGNLLTMMQNDEEGLKSLLYANKIAAESSDPKKLFATHYNLGVYFGKKGRISEALESYQAALDIKADSTEVKTNIELLIKQNQQQQGEKSQNADGQSGQDNQPKDGQDQSDRDKNKQQGENEPDNEKQADNNSDRQNSPKYKPRPFRGDQLSEGDVKKILGELHNQEQKIRANFDKKEKGKSKGNEKDW